VTDCELVKPERIKPRIKYTEQGEGLYAERSGSEAGGVCVSKRIKAELAVTQAHSSRREDGREESNGHINYRTLVCKIFLSPVCPPLYRGIPFGIGSGCWASGIYGRRGKSGLIKAWDEAGVYALRGKL
jgi:hypothetical protein